MSTEVWQNLPKAQDNTETIEQAIARIIADHNNDTEAHLGDNQSLSSHRASEIIDHEANSIVTDKILEYQITPNKTTIAAKLYFSNFADYSLWTKYVSGGSIFGGLAYALLYVPGTIGKIARLSAVSSEYEAGSIGESYRHTSVVRFYFDFPTYDIFIGMGTISTAHCGFEILNGVISAYNKSQSGTVTRQTIVGIDILQTNIYKVQVRDANHADYYINNVLVAQLSGITIDKPIAMALYQLKNNGEDDQNMIITQIEFYNG